ncbi:hypothetical protein L0337_01415 [candidate division KSB1 bacterium]|nr:hypothetical protein [candidate division KSB1 bacterium]
MEIAIAIGIFIGISVGLAAGFLLHIYLSREKNHALDLMRDREIVAIAARREAEIELTSLRAITQKPVSAKAL